MNPTRWDPFRELEDMSTRLNRVFAQAPWQRQADDGGAFADWAPAVSAVPAQAMGIDLGVLRQGGPADMILTRARDFTELLARPQSDRIVVRHGKASSVRPPDYAELDALFGLAP